MCVCDVCVCWAEGIECLHLDLDKRLALGMPAFPGRIFWADCVLEFMATPPPSPTVPKVLL